MRHPSFSFVSACFCVLCGTLFYGCTTTSKETAKADSTSVQIAPNTSSGGTTTSISTPSDNPNSERLTINEATVVLALTKPATEKICGRFAPADLVTMLYANEIKPDDQSTFTITDIQVTQLNASSQTYMAVIKRKKLGSESECVFDVFAFRDSTRSNPVLAHTTYEPDFDDAEITGVQQKKYQITDEEYALAFEWKASQMTDGREQKTTMLCLFRAHEGMMQPLFEVCTYTNAANQNDDASNASTEDRATLETVKTWGKDLYSILITRTQARKASSGGDSEQRTESRKTKILYQWDGMQFVQTNQLL